MQTRRGVGAMVRCKRAVVIGVLALLAGSASPARADKASDLAAASQSIGAALNRYTTLAGAANGANQAYAGYKWTQIYAETKPGSGAWAQIALSAGDAEKLLAIASTRCGPESSQVAAQTTGQLSQIMGAPAAAAYGQSRAVMCQSVQAAAQLMYRSQQYQAAKISGYSLKTFEKTLQFAYPENRVRTVSFRGAFKWYPDAQDTPGNAFTPEDRLTYVADFKWSEDPWMSLNVTKSLRDMQGRDEATFCLPFASWAFGCFNIVNVSGTTIAINSYAKFRATVSGGASDKTLAVGTIALTAPFAYLDQIAQMKEPAKQELLAQLQNQLSGMLNGDLEIVRTAQAAMARAAAP